MAQNIIPIRAFKDNYIWALLDGDSVWVVDPGQSEPVIQFLESNRYQLAGILLTHHHADHSGGIADLLRYANTIPVVGSHLSSISSINQCVKEGDTISCSSFELRVMEIPGHTLDHVAFYNDDMVFCGDTLFSAGCGRVFEGTTDMMFASLEKLMQLNNETRMYCGHEYTLANLQFAKVVEPENYFLPLYENEIKQKLERKIASLPSSLEIEKKINPFLRCHQPEILKAALAKTSKTTLSPQEVFAILREWKNNL